MVLKVRRKCAMTCDEFEAIGWDAQGSASSTDAQRAAAAEHAVSCARCGALRNSWEATRLELRSLAQLTTSVEAPARVEIDRKSTRLNSSHPSSSYAVFCLKKKRSRLHNPWRSASPRSAAVGLLTASCRRLAV